MGSLNKPTPDGAPVNIGGQQFLAMPQLIFMPPPNGHLGMLSANSASIYQGGTTIATQPIMSSQSSSQPTSVSLAPASIPSTIQHQANQLTVTAMPANMVTIMGRKMRAIAPKPMRTLSPKVSINVENSMPIETVNLTPDVAKKKSIPSKSKKKKDSPAKSMQTVSQVTQNAAPTFLQIPHPATSQSILSTSTSYLTGGQPQPLIYPPGFVSSNMAPVQYTQSLPSYPAPATFIQPQAIVAQQQAPQLTQVAQISQPVQSEGTTVVQETEVVNLTADDDILALAWQNVNDGDLSFLASSNSFNQESTAFQFSHHQAEDPLDTFLRSCDNSSADAFSNTPVESDKKSDEVKGKPKKITKKATSVKKTNESCDNGDSSKKVIKRKASTGSKKSNLDKLSENGIKETVVVDLQAMSSEANSQLESDAIHSVASLPSFDLNIDLLKFTSEDTPNSEINTPTTNTSDSKSTEPAVEIVDVTEKEIYSSISNEQFFEDLAKMSPNITLNDQSCADFLEQLTKEASSEIASDQETCVQLLQELVRTSPQIVESESVRKEIEITKIVPAETTTEENLPNVDLSVQSPVSHKSEETGAVDDKALNSECDKQLETLNNTKQQSETRFEITDPQSFEEMERFLLGHLGDAANEVSNSCVEEKIIEENSKTEIVVEESLYYKDEDNKKPVENSNQEEDDDANFLSSLDVSFVNESSINRQENHVNQHLEIISNLNLIANAELSEGISPIKPRANASWDKLDRVLKSCQRDLVGIDESLSSNNTTSSSSKIAGSDIYDQQSEMIHTDESYSNLFDNSSEKIAISDSSNLSISSGKDTNQLTDEINYSSTVPNSVTLNSCKLSVINNSDVIEERTKEDDEFVSKPRRGLPTSRRKLAVEKSCDKTSSTTSQSQNLETSDTHDCSEFYEDPSSKNSEDVQNDQTPSDSNDEQPSVDEKESSKHKVEANGAILLDKESSTINLGSNVNSSDQNVEDTRVNVEENNDSLKELVEDAELPNPQLEVDSHEPNVENIIPSDENVEDSVPEPVESTPYVKNGLDIDVIDVVSELENTGVLEGIHSFNYTDKGVFVNDEEKRELGVEISEKETSKSDQPDEPLFDDTANANLNLVLTRSDADASSTTDAILGITDEGKDSDYSDKKSLSAIQPALIETIEHEDIPICADSQTESFDKPSALNDDAENVSLAVLSKQLSNESCDSFVSFDPVGSSSLDVEVTHPPPKLTRHGRKKATKRKKSTSKNVSKTKEVPDSKSMPSLENEDSTGKLVEAEFINQAVNQNVDDECPNDNLNCQDQTSEVESCIKPAEIDDLKSENSNNNILTKASKKRKKSSFPRKRAKKSRKKESNVSNDLKNPLCIQIEDCSSIAPSSKENSNETNEKYEKPSPPSSFGLKSGHLFEPLHCSPMFNKTMGFQSNLSSQLPMTINSFSSSKFSEPNFVKIADNLPSFGDMKQTNNYELSLDDPSLDATSNVFPTFNENSKIHDESNQPWYNHKGSILSSPNQILFSDAEKYIIEKATQRNFTKQPQLSKRKKTSRKKQASKSSKKKSKKLLQEEETAEEESIIDFTTEVEHIPNSSCSEIIDVGKESPLPPSSETCIETNYTDEDVELDDRHDADINDVLISKSIAIDNCENDSPIDCVVDTQDVERIHSIENEVEKRSISEENEVEYSSPASPLNHSPDELPECNKENETVIETPNPVDQEASPYFEEPSSPLFPPELTKETIPEQEPLICVIPKLRIKKSKLKSKSKKRHRNKHLHNTEYSHCDNDRKVVVDADLLPSEATTAPVIGDLENKKHEEDILNAMPEINYPSLPPPCPSLESTNHITNERPPYLPRLTMTLPAPRQLPKPAENTSPSYYQRKNKLRIAAGVATKKIFSTCKEDRRSSYAQMNNFLQFGKSSGKKSKQFDENVSPIPIGSTPTKFPMNHSQHPSPQMKKKRGRPKKAHHSNFHVDSRIAAAPADPACPLPSSQPPLKMRFKLSGQSNGYQVDIPSVVSANESGDEMGDTYRPQLSDHVTVSHSREEPALVSPVNSPQLPEIDFMVAGEAEVFVDPHQAEVDRLKNRNYVKKHRLKHRERHLDGDNPDGATKSKKKKHRHHHNQVYTQMENRSEESSVPQCLNAQSAVNHLGLVDKVAETPSYSNDHINLESSLSNNTYQDQVRSQCWSANLNQPNIPSNRSHSPSNPFLQSPTSYNNSENYQSTNYHQSTPNSPDKHLRSTAHQSNSWNTASSLAYTSTPYPDQCGSSSNTAALMHNNSLNKTRDADCPNSDAILSPAAGLQDSSNLSMGRSSNGAGQSNSQYSIPTPGYQPTPYQQENPMSNRSMASPMKQPHSVGSGNALQSPAYHHSNPSSVSTPHCPPSNHSAAREEIDVGGPTRDSLPPEPRLPDLSIEDSLPDVDHSQNAGQAMRSHSTSESAKTASTLKSSSDNSLKSSSSNLANHSRSRNHTPQPTTNPAHNSSSSFYNPAAFYNNTASSLTRSNASPGSSTLSDWAASMYQAAAAQQHEAAYSQLASLYQQNYANASLYPAAAALRAHQHQNAAAYQGAAGANTTHANPWDFYSSHNPLQAYSDYTGHSAAEMLAAHHLLSNNFSNPGATVTSHQSATHGARASPNMMMFGSTNPMLPMPAHQGSVSTANSVASSSSSMAAAAAVAAGFHPGFSMHNFP